MNYKVGMLVIHPGKTEWGPGKVMKVSGSKVEVIFRDLPKRDVKVMNADIARLEPAQNQTDSALDRLSVSEKKTPALGKHRTTPSKSKTPKDWKPENMVLSVPAGETGHFVSSYLIHACPDSYSYRPTDYLTFRKTGGVMTDILKLVEGQIVILNPFDPTPLDEYKSQSYFDRLRGYVDGRIRQRSFSNEPYRFYILQKENLTVLTHKPEMMKNPQGHCYFTLDELTSGKKIVEVASSKRE